MVRRFADGTEAERQVGGSGCEERHPRRQGQRGPPEDRQHNQHIDGEGETEECAAVIKGAVDGQSTGRAVKPKLPFNDFSCFKDGMPNAFTISLLLFAITLSIIVPATTSVKVDWK